MKIEMTSTDKIVHISGLPFRIWEGKSGGGTPCFALIHRVAVPIEADAGEFEKELQEVHGPMTDEAARFVSSLNTPAR